MGQMLTTQTNTYVFAYEVCNFRKNMQMEKAPANQENIFILTADGANVHNTNK